MTKKRRSNFRRDTFRTEHPGPVHSLLPNCQLQNFLLSTGGGGHHKSRSTRMDRRIVSVSSPSPPPLHMARPAHAPYDGRTRMGRLIFCAHLPPHGQKVPCFLPRRHFQPPSSYSRSFDTLTEEIVKSLWWYAFYELPSSRIRRCNDSHPSLLRMTKRRQHRNQTDIYRNGQSKLKRRL